MSRGGARARTVVFALAAALIGALGLIRWSRREQPPDVPAMPVRSGLPAAQPTSAERAAVTATAQSLVATPTASDTPPPGTPAEASSPPRPTPAVFDLGGLPRSLPSGRAANDQDRFPTTSWFTREDQRHPERYFELAARMPELNRPEERRDTLEYFLAYRAKLDRELDAARGDREREEIVATITRYESAIARLRKLMEPGGAP